MPRPQRVLPGGLHNTFINLLTINKVMISFEDSNEYKVVRNYFSPGFYMLEEAIGGFSSILLLKTEELKLVISFCDVNSILQTIFEILFCIIYILQRAHPYHFHICLC